jgi:TetR/AcrR family transcriptional regulator, regulator of autoinduction and epiphytic fitness
VPRLCNTRVALRDTSVAKIAVPSTPASYDAAVPRRSAPPAEPRVDPRVERSRRVIREAALAELGAVGYGALTIDGVATRAGVARSTIYRHWPDKLTLVVDAFATLNQQPPGRPDALTPRERVAELVDHLVAAMRDPVRSSWAPAMIDAAERDRSVRALHHRTNATRRRALVDAVAAGVADGTIAPDVDPELAAFALAGAVFYARTMTPTPLAAERVPALVDLVLGPPPRRTRRSHPAAGRGSDRVS